MSIWFVFWSVCVWGLLTTLACLWLSAVASRKVIKRLASGFVILALLAGSLHYLEVRSGGKPTNVNSVLHQPAEPKLLLNLATMTSAFCSEGHFGGVFKPAYPEDLRSIVPDFAAITTSLPAVIWTYEFEPKLYFVDGNTLRITGLHTNSGQVAIFTIPLKELRSVKHLNLEE